MVFMNFMEQNAEFTFVLLWVENFAFHKIFLALEHFYSYRLVFYLFHEEHNDNSEDSTSLSAMVVVLDTAALKQDEILIFHHYLGQTIVALFCLHFSLTLQVLTTVWASQKKQRNLWEVLWSAAFFLYLALYWSITHQGNSHLSLFTNQ